ncbi:MAG: flagellar filament capping protein FliD [Deltaproteobacteria bacterium]|nr:flagellar filament capping protein FliD [Deltaproteobacteria bacterium]
MSGVGLVSGIDTATLIAQLMAVERRPLARLEKAKSNRQAQLTVLSDLRSKLDGLRTKVGSLKTTAAFAKINASSSDEDIATVSATGSAKTGNHTIKVTQLATVHQSVSQGFATFSAAIGTGTFRVNIDGEDHDVTINATNSTLSGLRDAINAADFGITASIVNDGGANPNRLVLASDESGTEHAHAISLVDWSGTQPAFTDGVDNAPGQQAKNAEFLFNGISVVKSSNEVKDLMAGVTVFLKSTDAEKTVNLGLTSNTGSVKKSIEDFVSAYNEVVSYLDGKLGSDSMKGDFTLRRIKSELSTILSAGNPNTGTDYKLLSQVGVSQQGGKLVVNSDELQKALEDRFDEVVKIFTTQGTAANAKVGYVNATNKTAAGTYEILITGVGQNLAGTIGGYAATRYSNNLLIGAAGTPVDGLMIRFDGESAGNYGNITVGVGVMESLERRLSSYTSFSDGLLKSQENLINDSIRDYKNRIEFKERQMDRVELGLKTRFTRLEAQLSQLQQSSNALASVASLRLF